MRDQRRCRQDRHARERRLLRLPLPAGSTVRCVVNGAGDATCPLEPNQGCEPEVITLERNATLDLNGFDLYSAYQEPGIVCSAGTRTKCTIHGPGNFFARKGRGITPNDRDVILRDLRIVGDYKGFTTAGWIRATDVTLEGCSAGMLGMAGVRATNVAIGQSCDLASGRNFYADHVSASDGLRAVGTLRGKDVSTRNGKVEARDIILTRSTIPAPLDTELDTYAKDVRATRRLVLRDSIIGGIESGEAPKLVRSTCMESFQASGGADWGVCALD